MKINRVGVLAKIVNGFEYRLGFFFLRKIKPTISKITGKNCGV